MSLIDSFFRTLAVLPNKQQTEDQLKSNIIEYFNNFVNIKIVVKYTGETRNASIEEIFWL